MKKYQAFALMDYLSLIPFTLSIVFERYDLTFISALGFVIFWIEWIYFYNKER